MKPTKAELLDKIAQLEKQQTEMFHLMDAFAAKCKVSFKDVYEKHQAHEVYLGMHDKNIMILDGLLNKVCCNIGIQLEQKPKDLN